MAKGEGYGQDMYLSIEKESLYPIHRGESLYVLLIERGGYGYGCGYEYGYRYGYG